MKLLTFTTLYPNTQVPRHGIFVEQRLRQLLMSNQVQSQVVAPVPWFPFKKGDWGSYSQYAQVPNVEVRNEIKISHPRYPLIPKIGMSVAPACLVSTSLFHIKKIIKSGYDFDVFDAHYFYPDGVAAAMIAKKLNKPCVITARGSDINLLSKFALPKKQILWAAKNASAIVTVSQALKDSLVEMGVVENKIAVLRNGVDLKIFKPVIREFLKKKLGLNTPILLSVGNLIELKGHDYAIKAMAKLPNHKLIIIGNGPQKQALQEIANQVGVGDRVKIISNIDQQVLAEYYGVADALILMSSREGWPNVLLESMACGTPVVVAPFPSAYEVVREKVAGRIITTRTVDDLVTGCKELFDDYPDREKTRKYAEQHSWQDVTSGQLDIFSNAISGVAL